MPWFSVANAYENTFDRHRRLLQCSVPTRNSSPTQISWDLVCQRVFPSCFAILYKARQLHKIAKHGLTRMDVIGDRDFMNYEFKISKAYPKYNNTWFTECSGTSLATQQERSSGFVRSVIRGEVIYMPSVTPNTPRASGIIAVRKQFRQYKKWKVSSIQESITHNWM